MKDKNIFPKSLYNNLSKDTNEYRNFTSYEECNVDSFFLTKNLYYQFIDELIPHYNNNVKLINKLYLKDLEYFNLFNKLMFLEILNIGDISELIGFFEINLKYINSKIHHNNYIFKDLINNHMLATNVQNDLIFIMEDVNEYVIVDQNPSTLFFDAFNMDFLQLNLPKGDFILSDLYNCNKVFLDYVHK